MRNRATQKEIKRHQLQQLQQLEQILMLKQSVRTETIQTEIMPPTSTDAQ
jgi:hypothetical protein